MSAGFHEAGEQWIERWCEDHAEAADPLCRSCLGESHDAWMHRAKAAEDRVAELEVAIRRHRETIEATGLVRVDERDADRVALKRRADEDLWRTNPIGDPEVERV